MGEVLENARTSISRKEKQFRRVFMGGLNSCIYRYGRFCAETLFLRLFIERGDLSLR